MKIITHKRCKYHVRDIVSVNNCRRLFIKFGIYIILLGVAILVALLPNVINSKKSIYHNRHARYATDFKYILFWKNAKKNKKNFFNKDDVYAPGQRLFINQNCSHINCFITYNKTLLSAEDFNAVVFNIHDIKKVRHFNLKRSHHQKYIFKSFEPAEDHLICNKHVDNFFNWTWSYKLDSDIPQPFINIYNSKHSLVGPSNTIKWTEDMKSTDPYKNVIRKKSKAVAWLVSRCKLKNKHLDFINDLRKELNGYNYSLDILGSCGGIQCAKEQNGCNKIVEKEYYFQLVLEDVVSQDYVTEIVANAMKHVTIPIVLGSNFSSFLPPGSYVNAASFDLKKLGAIIDYLIKNPSKYAYFFDWTRYYYYSTRPRSNICDLCSKLNEDSGEKSYDNFREWWNKDYVDICESMALYRKFNEINK